MRRRRSRPEQAGLFAADVSNGLPVLRKPPARSAPPKALPSPANRIEVRSPGEISGDRICEILDLAQELEAQERQIKLAILEMARAGDVAGILALVERWLDGPVSGVLKGRLEGKKAV